MTAEIVCHKVPPIVKYSFRQSSGGTVVVDIGDVALDSLPDHLGSTSERTLEQFATSSVLRVVTTGKSTQTLAVEGYECFLILCFLLGVCVVRHYGECSCPYSVFPGETRIKRKKEDTVGRRIEDNVSVDAFAVDVMGEPVFEDTFHSVPR